MADNSDKITVIMDLDTKMFTSKFDAALKKVQTSSKGKGGLLDLDARRKALSLDKQRTEVLIKHLQFEKKAAAIRKKLAQDDLISDNKIFNNRLRLATDTINKIKRAHESATNQRVAREFRAAKKIADQTLATLRRGRRGSSATALQEGNLTPGFFSSLTTAASRFFAESRGGLAMVAAGFAAASVAAAAFAGGVAAVVTGIAALGVMALKSFDALRKQELVTDGLAKSLGKLNGQYASVVKAFARSQADITLFDEKQILKGANLLAGLYENIDAKQQQAVLKAALDLSTLTQTDLFENIRSLGKALEDPLTGFDNLRERGFALDKQARERIKRLSEEAAEIKKLHGPTDEYKAKLAEASDKIFEMVQRFEGLAEGAIGSTISRMTQLQQIAASTASEWGRMVDEMLKFAGGADAISGVSEALKENRSATVLRAAGFEALNKAREQGRVPQSEFGARTGAFLTGIKTALGLSEVDANLQKVGKRFLDAAKFTEVWNAEVIELSERFESVTKEREKQLAIEKALLKFSEAEDKILADRERRASEIRRLPTEIEQGTGKFKEVKIAEGFRSSIESLVGLGRRIQAGAASTPDQMQLVQITKIVSLQTQNNQMMTALNANATKQLAAAEAILEKEITVAGGSTAILRD